MKKGFGARLAVEREAEVSIQTPQTQTHITNAALGCTAACNRVHSTFRRKEHPSVSLALPPVGWHKTVLQFPHSTTVCAWLKTVVLPNKRNQSVRIPDQGRKCTNLTHEIKKTRKKHDKDLAGWQQKRQEAGKLTC